MEEISLLCKVNFPKILGKIDLSKIDNSTKPKSSKEKCCYCGNTLHITGITKDHLIAKVKGGQNNKLNTKTCCSLCNGAKGSKYPEEFLHHFILKYRNRKGDINSKYRHIINFKRMIRNTLYIVYYVRGHGAKLFYDENYFMLYSEIRKEFNAFIAYLTDYIKENKE